MILDRKLALGERVRLRFRIPRDGDLIDIETTVRWNADDGVGLQFDGLRAREVYALGKYFETL